MNTKWLQPKDTEGRRASQTRNENWCLINTGSPMYCTYCKAYCVAAWILLCISLVEVFINRVAIIHVHTCMNTGKNNWYLPSTSAISSKGYTIIKILELNDCNENCIAVCTKAKCQFLCWHMYKINVMRLVIMGTYVDIYTMCILPFTSPRESLLLQVRNGASVAIFQHKTHQEERERPLLWSTYYVMTCTHVVYLGLLFDLLSCIHDISYRRASP